VKHSNASNEYSKRHAECQQALSILSKYNSSIKTYRDVTLNDLESFESCLNIDQYTRARHVVMEIQRVLQTIEILNKYNSILTSSNKHHDNNNNSINEKNIQFDWSELGRLLTQSHVSLKNDFEVSCSELDEIVDIALEQNGVYGARMVGAGFGGSSIIMVESKVADIVEETILAEYFKRTNGKVATAIQTTISHGPIIHS